MYVIALRDVFEHRALSFVHGHVGGVCRADARLMGTEVDHSRLSDSIYRIGHSGTTLIVDFFSNFSMGM